MGLFCSFGCVTVVEEGQRGGDCILKSGGGGAADAESAGSAAGLRCGSQLGRLRVRGSCCATVDVVRGSW